MRRLVIGITGSTGAIFGVRMLEALKDSDVESHLIISKWAQRTLEHETHYTVEQVRALATVVHSPGDMGASISSGSFKTEGMAVMPCSVHTLAGIANGYGEHLVHRAADGVRLRDASHGPAGACAADQLAVLGDDANKVEDPDEPDERRANGPDKALNRRNMGSAFLTQASNKRSIALGLKLEGDREVLKK